MRFYPEPADYAAAVDGLVTAGDVASVDALRVIWPALNRAQLLDAQRDVYAERHIADVLRLVAPQLDALGAPPPPLPAVADAHPHAAAA